MNHPDPPLPISRPEPAARSTLHALRALMPPRPLRLWEQSHVAERQASRLLALHGIAAPPVPSSIISGLPRLEVALVAGLPVSGVTQWLKGRWLISLAAHEPPARLRFSLGHEFKHVLDHPFRERLSDGRSPTRAVEQAEQICDYFSACLLMPKRFVVRAWTDGIQRARALGELFEVSPQAMGARLWQLGLLEHLPPWHRYASSAYHRLVPMSALLGAAA